MARPSSTGLPYLTARSDSGKLAYWRTIPADIAPFVVGDLRLSWTVRNHPLTGKSVVKVSLKTGDETTARNRWSEVHTQVNELIDEATRRGRRVVDRAGSLKKRASLSAEERGVMAGQARHDLLADHDEEWADPDYLSTSLARGLQQALKARGRAATLPDGLREFLRRFPDDLSDGQIRAEAREIEQSAVREALKAGSTFPVDGVEMSIFEAAPGPRDGIPELTEVGRIPSEFDRRLKENGIELVAAADADRRKGALAILQGKAAGFGDIAAREDGRMVETPVRPAPIVEPKAAENKFPGLQELHAEWVRLKRPGQKAIDDNLLYIKRFIEMHGDLPADKITRRHCREYRNELLKYPRGMTTKMRTMTHQELIAFMDKANTPNKTIETLSRVTINDKALAAISTLLTLAVQEFDLNANPCVGLRLAIREGDQIVRLPFSLEDLERLFASPIYQNPPKMPAAGGGAAAFWLPLISLFSGQREEEIGQLLTSDIKRAGGIDYFELKILEDEKDFPEPKKSRDKADENRKKFKTEAAQRRIPIHHVLVQIGFLDYVERRRERGDKRLFPKLHAYRGRLTKNWSRWWGRYQKKHMSAMEEKTFHGFRHTFIEAMKYPAQVPREVKKAFVGHAKALNSDDLRPETIDKYGHKLAPLGLLNEWMQKIDYPGLDLFHLRAVAKLID